MEKVKKIVNIILIIIMIPIIFVSGVILVNSYINPDEVPSFFDWKPFIVLSGSMETEIYPGDVVIVKEIDPNTLKKGDIIAFRQKEVVITHRIVEVIEENGEKRFVTKGDNNNENDQSQVELSDVEGVFKFKVKGIGNFAMFLQTPVGMVTCLSIPLALLILMQVSQSKKEQQMYEQTSQKEKNMQEEIERLKKENEALTKKDNN